MFTAETESPFEQLLLAGWLAVLSSHIVLLRYFSIFGKMGFISVSVLMCDNDKTNNGEREREMVELVIILLFN